MYKIYINETPLILAKLESNQDLPMASPTRLVTRYPGIAKMLLNYIDMLEKSQRFEMVYLYTEDYDQLVKDFQSHFKWIEAAGGYILNPENKVLAIYRRGSWDLPKGKIDPGETPKIAAIREVQEETGIEQVTIKSPLQPSFHTYRLKSGKRVLKKTHWYIMETVDTLLTPQTEEDIEQAIWIEPQQFLEGDYPMYRTIQNVVKDGLGA